MQLILSPSKVISESALKVLGSLLYENNWTIQKLISTGILDCLEYALRHSQASMQKEALYALSNLIADRSDFIQYVVEHPVSDIFIEKLRDTDFVVKKRISFILLNISVFGRDEHIKVLVEKHVFSGLKYALRGADCELLKNFLGFIKKSLDCEEKCGDKAITNAFYDSGCLEVLEILKKNLNPIISELSLSILQYFITDCDVEMM